MYKVDSLVVIVSVLNELSWVVASTQLNSKEILYYSNSTQLKPTLINSELFLINSD
jgi:hypothetical protein